MRLTDEQDSEYETVGLKRTYDTKVRNVRIGDTLTTGQQVEEIRIDINGWRTLHFQDGQIELCRDDKPIRVSRILLKTRLVPPKVDRDAVRTTYLEELQHMVDIGETVSNAITRVNPNWGVGTWRAYAYLYGFRGLGEQLLRLEKQRP